MTIELSNIPWSDIQHAGYVHAPAFLTDCELQLLRSDWLAQAATRGANENYGVIDASERIIASLREKLSQVAAAVRAATGLNADAEAGTHYFSIGKGIDFSWHQDHESYFVFQQHLEYLNLYIPVIKPVAALSNLCLVPFGRLREAAPDHYARFVGSGAKALYPNGSKTLVRDDQNDSRFALPVNIEELKVTPVLNPGDLLLMRGDVIHRTQDTQTERVAISFRRTRASAPIFRDKLAQGGAFKHDVMRKNELLYARLVRAFQVTASEQITAAQFLATQSQAPAGS